MVINETILDEYVYCEALGKSGKDPVLVLRSCTLRDIWAGLSIAKNLSSFVRNKFTELFNLTNMKVFCKNLEKIYQQNLYKRMYNIKKTFLDNINKSRSWSASINDENSIKNKKQNFIKN